MARHPGTERGQALVEMALLILPILLLTAGLIDVGRAFYQYNAISGAARNAARWGAVVGANCATNDAVFSATSTTDWCHQMGANTTQLFWAQAGNAPLQGANNSCQTSLPDSSQLPAGTSSTSGDTSSTGGFYNVAQYAPPTASSSTTVVGTVAQHFDTNANSSVVNVGAFIPGVNLSNMWACVELVRGNSPPPPTNVNTFHYLMAGDRVRVFVYYRFSAVTPLLTAAVPPLIAEAEFPVA